MEDELVQRRLLRLKLEKQGYQVIEAVDGRQGLDFCLRDPEIRLVITDLLMPEMDGFKLIEAIRRQESRYTYILVLTALDDKDSIVRALSLGADDYLCKPGYQEELNLRLEAARRLLVLEGHDELIFAMAELTGFRSGETGSHLHRIREYTRLLAVDLVDHHPELGLSSHAADEIANLSPLHDIGKVAVPDTILHKPGKLTAAEFELMKNHTLIGGTLLKRIYDKTRSPYLRLAYEIAMFHHERWDGTGYPRGLAGDEIPVAARLVALADVFDALTTKRCYKEAFAYERAREIVVDGRGSHFDPRVVDAYLRLEAAWRLVADRYGDEAGEAPGPAQLWPGLSYL